MDLDDVAHRLAPRPLKLEGLVNGLNLTVDQSTLAAAYRRTAAGLPNLSGSIADAGAALDGCGNRGLVYPGNPTLLTIASSLVPSTIAFNERRNADPERHRAVHPPNCGSAPPPVYAERPKASALSRVSDLESSLDSTYASRETPMNRRVIVPTVFSLTVWAGVCPREPTASETGTRKFRFIRSRAGV